MMNSMIIVGYLTTQELMIFVKALISIILSISSHLILIIASIFILGVKFLSAHFNSINYLSFIHMFLILLIFFSVKENLNFLLQINQLFLYFRVMP